MTRISKKTNVLVSLEEAQAAAHNYAFYSNKKDLITTKMNEELAAVRQQYEPDITAIDSYMTDEVGVLESYAIATRDEWGSKKSLELGGCVIGFRTNPPSLSKKKGITWDYIVGLMKANKVLKPFIRVKEDVDKTALLKQQTDDKLMKQLASLGVTVKQEEQFYVDAKKEKAA